MKLNSSLLKLDATLESADTDGQDVIATVKTKGLFGHDGKLTISLAELRQLNEAAQRIPGWDGTGSPA